MNWTDVFQHYNTNITAWLTVALVYFTISVLPVLYQIIFVVASGGSEVEAIARGGARQKTLEGIIHTCVVQMTIFKSLSHRAPHQ